MSGEKACSCCQKKVGDSEGLEAFGRRFCATCFIAESAKFHQALRPEDIALLKTIGRETAGYLPPELLRMIAVGFWKRATGKPDYPPEEELALFVGEVQRLAAFANFTRVMNLLQTWQDTFNEFVEGQQGEIREAIKKLTDFDQERT